MMVVVLILLFLAVITIWYRFANSMKRLYRKWQGLLLVFKMMNGLAAAQKPSQASVIVNDSDQSLTVAYEKNGIKRSLFLPFKRSSVIHMNDIQMRLTMPNGTMVDITQEPGVPYLCSAAELGGINITAYNVEDETSHVFDLHEKPMYCNTY